MGRNRRRWCWRCGVLVGHGGLWSVMIDGCVVRGGWWRGSRGSGFLVVHDRAVVCFCVAGCCLVDVKAVADDDGSDRGESSVERGDAGGVVDVGERGAGDGGGVVDAAEVAAP